MTLSDTCQIEFDALMDSAEAFVDYLETHDDLDEVELEALHAKLTEDLGRLLGWEDEIVIEPPPTTLSERVRRETEEYLSTSCEFEAFVDEAGEASRETGP